MEGGMVAHLAEMLTTSEAARAAGVSEQTIRLWAKSGRLPFTATKHGALIDPVTLGQIIAARDPALPSVALGGRPSAQSPGTACGSGQHTRRERSRT